MTLKLNETLEAYKAFPEQGTAPIVEQMPKLIADNRVPMSVAQLMQRRLDTRNASNEVKTNWMDNYFDTGDAVAYHPDGRVKVVLDSQHLRETNPDTELKNGALVLNENAYKTLEGEEFKKGQIGQIEKWLSKKDAKIHPIWRVLARDQTLLDDYVDYIFAEAKQRFNYDIVMGVYPSSAGDTPNMRAWCIVRLVSRSDAVGWNDLGNWDGRLVGLAPEAQSTPVKGVGRVKAYTMDDAQKYVKAVKKLKDTFGPDSDLVRDISVLENKV